MFSPCINELWLDYAADQMTPESLWLSTTKINFSTHIVCALLTAPIWNRQIIWQRENKHGNSAVALKALKGAYNSSAHFSLVKVSHKTKLDVY